MDKLSAMAAHAARRVERLKAESPAAALRLLPLYSRAPRDVSALLAGGPGSFADLRFADPERGLLVAGGEVSAESAARRAEEAMAAGAPGLAVWTERHFHAGDYSHLDAARRACPDAPILMMDYVVDPWQLERARAGGADAVLLIPDILGPYLERLTAAARELRLSPVLATDP